MDKKIFEDEFLFKPYQSVGSLSFNENENDISDDFKISSGGDYTCYTSEKLGIDFDFNDENNCLCSLVFMSKEYYKNEI